MNIFNIDVADYYYYLHRDTLEVAQKNNDVNVAWFVHVLTVNDAEWKYFDCERRTNYDYLID